MWSKIAVVGLGLVALAGCQSAEERRAAQMAQCEQYGFQRGTDAFANCMLELDKPRAREPGVTFGVGIGVGM